MARAALNFLEQNWYGLFDLRRCERKSVQDLLSVARLSRRGMVFACPIALQWEGRTMPAISANPKVARGLKNLYAQMRDHTKDSRVALRERDFAIIDMSVVPAEIDGSAAQPITDADLIRKLSEFSASIPALPSKLWSTDTLLHALRSFLQSLKNEANESPGNADWESNGRIAAAGANA
jgi:hypothetical protein